jgi:hypothetical protein
VAEEIPICQTYFTYSDMDYDEIFFYIALDDVGTAKCEYERER